MSSVSGLSAPHRIEARDRFVDALYLTLKRKDEIHYTQGPLRWEGINKELNARMGQFPKHGDCSSTLTWGYWNGLYIPFKVRDTVNGAHWDYGYTGSMLQHGKEVKHLANVLRADAVIYGPKGSDGEHTAGVVGRRKSDHKIMVISHGSEGGPYYLPYDYRDDFMCFRRYI